MQKTVLCIIGTRPEAIKMAPVIIALKKELKYKVRIMVTAQHRQMLDQVLKVFSIVPDIDLDIMQPNQTLATLTARLITGIDGVLQNERPDLVLAQGDTTTVFAASIASFYLKIPFGHIEAGLRTGNINSPFPEEMNRIFTSHLSRFHFAPTESACVNLINEGVSKDNIYVTGNTVIDALHIAVDRVESSNIHVEDDKKIILVTVHRRENFGRPFNNICQAISELLKKNTNIEIHYPVHFNPNIRNVAYNYFLNNSRVKLLDPLDYLPFVAAMKKAYIILTDSGGVQEEAPALGKPVLVLREETERPEAIDFGVVKLVGTETENIVRETQKLLDDPSAYREMAKGVSPYGDGEASRRIVNSINAYFN